MIAPSLTGKVGRQLHETRPTTGVAVLPRESTGSISGRCGWDCDMAKLPERSDSHDQSAPIPPWPPACARSDAPTRVTRGTRGDVPLAGSMLARVALVGSPRWARRSGTLTYGFPAIGVANLL